MKKIITIGRQFGSGGREVGQKVAQALHIAYYDKELLMVAAKTSGLSRQFMNTYDEKPTRSFLYSLVMGQRGLFPDSAETTVEQLAANAQRDAILAVAGEGSCVIVGRCADHVLRNEQGLLRVFLTADHGDRIQRICRRDSVTAARSRGKAAKEWTGPGRPTIASSATRPGGRRQTMTCASMYPAGAWMPQWKPLWSGAAARKGSP